MIRTICEKNREISNYYISLFSVPIPQSEAKESKPDVVEELMKKMFMRKVMAKFFGDANGMLSIFIKQNWADLCNYFQFKLD